MSLRFFLILVVVVLMLIGGLVFFVLPGNRTSEPSATESVSSSDLAPRPVVSGTQGTDIVRSRTPIPPESDAPEPLRTATSKSALTSAQLQVAPLMSRWIGIGRNGATSTVRKATSDELLLPFLHRSVSEESLVFSELAIPALVFSAGESAYTNQRLKELACIFDVDSGRLVQAMIADPDAGVLPGEMQIEKAEARYRGVGEEYLGLADVPPKVTLRDILRKLPDVSMADVRKSRRITASYLVFTENEVREPMHVWVVHCQGFPAYPSLAPDHGRGEPRDERTFLRFLFDKNGVFLQADNQPLVTGPWTKGGAQ